VTSDIADKWQSYADTILEFCVVPPLRIDLRCPVTPDETKAFGRLGLDRPFAVFTAENPCGENSEDAPTASQEVSIERRNARRISRLERELTSRGIHFVLVDGGAPDGSYREHCVAAVMIRDEAIAFARSLEQLALFWFDGQSFWQLPAEVDAPPRRLPAKRG
jgi:uncharacterized protein DUF3293